MEEVTPSVAVEALKLILTLEASPSSSHPVAPFAGLRTENRRTAIDQDGRPDTFRCQAFVNMILDIIYRSKDPKVLTDGLEVICSAPENTTRPFVEPNHLMAYKDKLFEEVRWDNDDCLKFSPKFG